MHSQADRERAGQEQEGLSQHRSDFEQLRAARAAGITVNHYKIYSKQRSKERDFSSEENPEAEDFVTVFFS
ncbi:hypothetical protein D3C76_1633290 [compost metagenome]